MINQKFDYLYTENGRLKAVVVDNNGEPQVTDVTPDKPYSQSLITDGQGDTLVVSKKGQVMGVKEYKFAGDDRHLLNEYHRQLDSLGDWQINFLPDTKHQTYAFDQIGSGNHGIFATDEYYPTSGNYDFRYKSVECGKNDKVIVDFGAYPDRDSVIFKDKYGVKLKVVDGNILSFTGVSQPDTNYIYAYRGDKKIGKLFLNTYQQKTYKVVLVRVNEAAKKLDIDKVNEVLNKVYNQCAVKFEISIEEFDLRDLTSFSHGGSGILTVYNDDQKRVLSAYEKEKKMKDGVFYLFFIDNVTDKKDGNGTPVSGYMPRGYNAGFIYDGGSPHTIAHELGHGIAGFEHVFENSSNSGKTANLMDYASGEELWHFQWDQIQDPSRVWMKWNKAEEEGENIEQFVFPNEKCKNVYLIFSPYVSRKFQLLVENSYFNVPKILEVWSNNRNTINASTCKTIINLIDTVNKSDQYLANVKTFKGQYNVTDSKVSETPVVKYYYNPEGTINDIAVYYLIGQSTNIEKLEQLDNKDSYIKHPYTLSRSVIRAMKPLPSGRLKERERTISDIIDKYTVWHLDFVASGQAGYVSDKDTKIGAEVNNTFGFAFDSENIALYGNCKLVTISNNHMYDINAKIEQIRKFLIEMILRKDMLYINEEKSKASEIWGADICACLSISWDWGYDKLPDIFGNSWSWSTSFSLIKGVSLSLENNANDKPVGISVDICKGAGLSVSHNSNYVKGIIFHQTEIFKLFSALFDFEHYERADKSFEGFREENGKVVYYSNGLKIVTGMKADKDHSNDDYVITETAYNAKKYPETSNSSNNGGTF